MHTHSLATATVAPLTGRLCQAGSGTLWHRQLQRGFLKVNFNSPSAPEPGAINQEEPEEGAAAGIAESMASSPAPAEVGATAAAGAAVASA